VDRTGQIWSIYRYSPLVLAGLSLFSGTTIPLRPERTSSTVHGVVIVPRPDTRGAEVDRDGRPRIMIVDGQTLFVDALAGILGRPPLSAVTRTASRSDQAVQMLNSSRADLVLCDVKVQPLPLRSFLAQVRDAPGAPPVVLLGDAEDEASLVATIDTEVEGLFTKDVEPDEFLEGVRAVLAGHRAIGTNVLRRLIARHNGTEVPAVRNGLAQLSPTEVDILAMVGAASTVEQIARARGISQKTVRNHLANIYRKLELRTRTEAMLCAARLGLVSAG